MMFVTARWSKYQPDNASGWAPKGTITHCNDTPEKARQSNQPYTDNESGILRATSLKGREPNISADYWKRTKNSLLSERGRAREHLHIIVFTTDPLSCLKTPTVKMTARELQRQSPYGSN